MKPFREKLGQKQGRNRAVIGRDRPYAISEKSVSGGLERSMVIDEGVRIPMHASTRHLSLAF
jgi:hypothetical protein